MPVPESIRRLFIPVGLVLGFVALLLIVWAYSGTRTLDLSYFFIALAAALLLVAAVTLAAFGRALAPRGRARRKGSSGAARPSRSLPKGSPPVQRVEEASPVVAIAPLERPRDEQEDGPVPIHVASEPAPVAPFAPLGSPMDLPPGTMLRCPACEAVFPPPISGAKLICPACGAEGDLPEPSAPVPATAPL
ncbi:MAG: hypothetical protein ACYDDF_14030 [Thermoplasmatota archaeon]